MKIVCWNKANEKLMKNYYHFKCTVHSALKISNRNNIKKILVEYYVESQHIKCQMYKKKT